MHTDLKKFAQDYFNILFTNFAGLNLTAMKDFDDFYIKQILDAQIPVDECLEFNKTLAEFNTIIDVGFGGGFPLLVLAKLYPNKQFIGLEARGKKAHAVSEIAHILGLSNVKTFHLRIEELIVDIPALITFKAVGKVQDFLPMINSNHLQKVYFYKSISFNEAEEVFLSKIPQWKIFSKEEYNLQGADSRLMVGFVGKNVLRGTTKNLVKLSDIL
jgi:16S rRNA (guanine527-N7)-methyltransferase